MSEYEHSQLSLIDQETCLVLPLYHGFYRSLEGLKAEVAVLENVARQASWGTYQRTIMNPVVEQKKREEKALREKMAALAKLIIDEAQGAYQPKYTPT